MISLTRQFQSQKLLKASKELINSLVILLSRLVSIAPNFSPVGGFAFVTGNPFFFLVPILLFDFLVGGFYSGFIFTYVGFFAYYFLGRLAKNNVKKQLLLLPIASLLFFLVSNFGVWYFWYPRTISGLRDCYLLAIPFYRNSLFGDLFFGYLFVLLKNWGTIKSWIKQTSGINSFLFSK